MSLGWPWTGVHTQETWVGTVEKKSWGRLKNCLNLKCAANPLAEVTGLKYLRTKSDQSLGPLSYPDTGVITRNVLRKSSRQSTWQNHCFQKGFKESFNFGPCSAKWRELKGSVVEGRVLKLSYIDESNNPLCVLEASAINIKTGTTISSQGFYEAWAE